MSSFVYLCATFVVKVLIHRRGGAEVLGELGGEKPYLVHWPANFWDSTRLI